jgi:hypothetical protein
MGKLGKKLTESQLGRWLADERVQNAIMLYAFLAWVALCLALFWLVSQPWRSGPP